MNAHWATIYPYFFRRLEEPDYRRHRLELPDGDFLDLDARGAASRQGALLIHGLEGSASSKYVLGMGQALQRAGYHVTALNLRGCSGVPNRLPISYHSGKTDDLQAVVLHLLTRYAYDSLALVGFSLGGNLLLKYMGEGQVPERVRAAAAISVPCDLANAVQAIRKSPWYLYWLLQKLKTKALQRLQELPQGSLPFTAEQIKQAKDFEGFDDLYTAPVHGFASAQDYYARCSSGAFLSSITRPALLINALDDPFLGQNCYPEVLNPAVTTLYPPHGGHVGFADDWRLRAPFWHERQVLSFFAS
ncbi:MAG: YheT family hydrolase [Bernardetiaceae bacterium]